MIDTTYRGENHRLPDSDNGWRVLRLLEDGLTPCFEDCKIVEAITGLLPVVQHGHDLDINSFRGWAESLEDAATLCQVTDGVELDDASAVRWQPSKNEFTGSVSAYCVSF